MAVDSSNIIGDSEEVDDILLRFADDVPAFIYCGKGWLEIIRKCDEELFKRDPNYRVTQIKEKLGGLRFYFTPSDMDRYHELSGIIFRIEEESLTTCEQCGNNGYRRKTESGIYYVSCDEHDIAS